jgi:hypothetical protein
MRNVFIDDLAGQLPGPDSALRAQLLTAQLGGLIQARSTIEDAGLSDGDRDRVIELYGRAPAGDHRRRRRHHRQVTSVRNERRLLGRARRWPVPHARQPPFSRS